MRRRSMFTVAALLVLALPNLAAAAPGTGYQPQSNTSCFRETVSGPEICRTGDLSISPWAVAGIPDTGYLPCDRPDVNAAHAARYGVPCSGPVAPRGGWTRGPSNEALGSRGIPALQWFCENDPAYIHSPGRAGGYDCVTNRSSREATDMSAFNGWGVVFEYERRTNAPPPSGCALPERCMVPPAPCATCTVCTPPPPLPVLLPIPRESLAACKAMLGWWVGAGKKARIKAACDWQATALSYRPGPASTARNELTLSQCAPAAP